MSGAKRRSQYRKGVTSQYLQAKGGGKALDEDIVAEGDVIAQITANNGGQIFSAELEDKSVVQVKLPNKFHKVIWVRPGDLVVLENSQGADVIDIKSILSKDMVKQLTKEGVIPEAFRPADATRNGRGYDMDSLLPPMDDEDDDGNGDFYEQDDQSPPDQPAATAQGSSSDSCQA